MPVMQHKVEIHYPTRTEFSEDDYQRLGELLGKPPLRLEKRWIRTAPWITVNNRIHTVASWWLRHIEAKYATSTFEQKGRDLCAFIDWLVNDKGFWAANEFESDIWQAADYDPTVPHSLLLEYLKSLNLKDARWDQLNATLRDFFWDASQIWQVRPPMKFTVKEKAGWTFITNGLEKTVPKGPVSFPLHPEFCDFLVKSAMRLAPGGTTIEHTMASRDAAWCHLLLATGMRHESALMATIFEIPKAPSGRAAKTGLNSFLIPNATAKNGRGSSGLAIEWRLAHVRTFIKEKRPIFLKSYAPAESIVLDATKTTLQTWEGKDTSTGEDVSGEWNDTDADERLRMVVEHEQPDGTKINVSPLIWLTDKGQPLSFRQSSRIIFEARKFAAEHWDERFPQNFRTHDCRHTYAVQMAAATYWNVVAQAVQPNMKSAFSANLNPTIAVQIVQATLGHTTNHTTTQTYLQHLATFIAQGLTADDVLKEKDWSR